MNMTLLIVGILLLLSIGGFLLYSSLAVRHASRFRYLSIRTVYASLLFILTSLALILAIVSTYIGALVEA